MMYDIIIKNGIKIDPFLGESKKEDVFIYNGKIAKNPKNNACKAKEIIDASNHYITPGLIENHTHAFFGGGEVGLCPDLYFLPNCVTTVIDQGSAGVSNFDAFYKLIIATSITNIKAFLNISSVGMGSESYFENLNPIFFEREKIKDYLEKYNKIILGLKIRLSKESENNMGFLPLKEGVKLANELNCPLSVHIRNQSMPLKDYGDFLRKGDVWVHMYQINNKNILDNNGKIYKEILKAKERGVLFDVAGGRSSFSFELMKKAFNEGFKPDFLGTDLVTINAYGKPVFSLLYTMSIYLALGYTLEEVIKLVTFNPAKFMKEEENLASLKEGSVADIAIIQKKEKEIIFNDKYGNSLQGKYLLIPKMTIKDGKIVYCNTEFNL